ncbi:MAG: hypothetical protein JW753_01265 [Dehalococcoidia bacterium]|nr:hypothetical protein [Dehalococcoidia bacterium]
MHKLSARLSVAATLVLLAFFFAWPIATASTIMAAGLGVTGSLLDVTMDPGTTHVHTMTVSNGYNFALDMGVEARGLGQGLDGLHIALTGGEDLSPFSALSYITEIDNTAFHLDAGDSQVVKATISVPSDATPGTRYACVYVYTQPIGEGEVGVSQATTVPFIVTVPDSVQVKIGDITGLTVSELKSGEPIEVSTTFKNMGTYHYKVTNQVTIKDGAGEVFSDAATELTASSIIPTFSRFLSMSCIPSNANKGLPPGEYLVVSKVMLEDGTVLDVETAGLTVPEWYKPPTPEPKEPREIDWPVVVIGILGALVLLIIVMYLILRRVRKSMMPSDGGVR